MNVLRKVSRVGHCGRAMFSMFLVVVFLIASGDCARGYIRNYELNKAPKNQESKLIASFYKGQSREIPAGQAEPISRSYTVEDGDTFFEILKTNGVSGEDALSIIKKTRRVFNVSKIKPGNQIQLIFSPNDQSLIELNYEISDLKKLVITVSGERIKARKVEVDKEEHFIPANEYALVQDEYPSMQAQPAERPQGSERTAMEKQESSVPGKRQIDIKVKKGHSLFDILSDLGVGRSEIDTFTKSVKGVYNLASIRPEKTISIWLSQEKPSQIERLTYEVNDTDYLDVTAEEGSFLARMRTLTRDVRFESASGKIGSSLYGSAVAGGVNPEIVMKLADIFAYDINFFTGIHPGDTYSVLYEKYYVKDQFKGYGRVMAAKFVNQGVEHVAVYYDNKRKDVQGYYDAKGRPIKKMFLKAPLSYRRISSSFSRNRLHPISGVVRPHLGVDYAAPSGTPVCSLGPGRVVYRGWVNGFGNTIRVRHPEGYISYYGHLSRFAKRIAMGKKVDQGDTIGYVGSTGYSTGPHLDFRVSCNGKYINPLGIKNVNGPALRGRTLADFKRVSNQRLAMMENMSRSIALAIPNQSGKDSRGVN